MKGVTPVIAIILLLLITISIIGFAFVYLNRIATTAGTSAEQEVLSELERQSQRLVIVNIDKTNFIVTVQNVGTSAVATNTVATFVSGVSVTCDWGTTASIAAGETAACDITGTCDSGDAVRLTFPGGSDAIAC